MMLSYTIFSRWSIKWPLLYSRKMLIASSAITSSKRSSRKSRRESLKLNNRIEWSKQYTCCHGIKSSIRILFHGWWQAIMLAWPSILTPRAQVQEIINKKKKRSILSAAHEHQLDGITYSALEVRVSNNNMLQTRKTKTSLMNALSTYRPDKCYIHLLLLLLSLLFQVKFKSTSFNSTKNFKNSQPDD